MTHGWYPLEGRWAKPDIVFGEDDMSWADTSEEALKLEGSLSPASIGTVRNYEVTTWLADKLRRAGELVTEGFLGKSIWTIGYMNDADDEDLSSHPVFSLLDDIKPTSEDPVSFLITKMEEIAVGSEAEEDGEGEEFDLEGQNQWLASVAMIARGAVATARKMIADMEPTAPKI